MSNNHNWNKEMQKQVLRCKPSRFENIYIFDLDLLALGTFLGLIVLKLSVLFPPGLLLSNVHVLMPLS